MNHWKIDDEKEILKARVFSVYRQAVTTPDNLKKEYIVVKRRPTVSVIPYTDDGYIYLVGQERYLLGKFAWELMAGFVEEGEKPLSAAGRELKEETGIEAAHWQKLAELEMSATGIRAVSYIYLARGLKFGQASPDETEFLSLKKVTLKEAVEEVLNGKINNSVSSIGILMLDKLKFLKKI